jgi:general secretion pathway protein F
MPRFAYSARDRSGQSVSATLEAPGRREAIRILGARGLQVSSISEAGGGAKAGAASAGTKKAAPLAFLKAGSEKPTRADRLAFLEALSDLMSSGMSAGESVRLLSQRIKEPRMKVLCGGLWERLSEGGTLSRAMGEFPVVFDAATVNLIQAGEATGSLNDTVARIITHLVEEREMKRKLVSAMTYPAILMLVAGGVITFFMVFLLPRMQTLLKSLGGKLPPSTQLLVNMSDFTKAYGIFVVIALGIVLVMFWQWRNTEPGRLATDGWLLKLPLVGPFVMSQTILSFSQTLAVLLENGITAIEALRMTERQIGNRVHRAAFNTATARVMEGESLSQALLRTKCFPDLVLDRLSVGENTGNVVPSLKDIAKAFQKDITHRLEMFTNVITTGVLLVVFVFVGFIAFAIVSAVFTLSSSFSH